ncbi:MAG TPA: tetratricopeptide repeat protein [Acidobacteriaceae bacterium]|nr:tetratricopeptide repeat protein [Acidobacteriaceae bacterium]
MKWNARIPVLAVAAFALLSSSGCKKLEARDQLNKGVQAYKSAQYEEAIDHFQNSIDLDPNYPMARLYLATAYAQQVVPNVDTPDNLQVAQSAIQNFQAVLQNDPNDTTSLKQIAAINFNIKNFDVAKQYQQKVIAVDPKDAEANYTIGVIDWTQAYQNAVKTLADAGIKDDGEGNAKKDKATCAKLQTANGALVNEGLQYLLQAVNIRPNYEDAMSYINLMYRRKADLECGDDAARKADVASAQDWVTRAMGARKANEEKLNNAAPAGVEMPSQ